MREFEGWTPTAVTTYERDEHGDIIRATTVTESAWDDTQRAWMLALAAYRASRCPGCGGNLAETTHPDNEGAYHTEPARCHKCTAMAIAAKPFHQPDVTAPHAVLYSARLRTRRG